MSSIPRRTALGVCRMIPNPDHRFGDEDSYFHVVVDAGGGFRHLVLTNQQLTECQTRAERGLSLLPDVPWHRRLGTFWRFLRQH